MTYLLINIPSKRPCAEPVDDVQFSLISPCFPFGRPHNMYFFRMLIYKDQKIPDI